jgi:soluble lytic murein transglycosylase
MFVIFITTLLALTPQKNPSNFAEGIRAFQQGHYQKAGQLLATMVNQPSANLDYQLYFLGESQFYAGNYAQAEQTFGRLEKIVSSRFAPQMPFRRADCLWMQGKRKAAVLLYQSLSKRKVSGIDSAVGDFRQIAFAEESALKAPQAQDAQKTVGQAYLALHVEFPAHPLGHLAGERAKALHASMETQIASNAPALRLKRAARLAKERHWKEAEDELNHLSADLPAEQEIERDLALGLVKYQSRSDYRGAAKLLLGVAPRLTGERAANAAFHGARALSRLDEDDEAIDGYNRVVRTYPSSQWASEAQFRAGWLDFNRGRFREALPGLQKTLSLFPKSSYADDAAWYLTLAHYFLGDFSSAMDALDRFSNITRSEDAQWRATYFKGRILQKTGRQAAAIGLYTSCAQKAPFSYYGLLSEARLREAKEPLPRLAPLPKTPPLPEARDPALVRSLALAQAGLDIEAGFELVRAEKQILRRLTKAHGIPLLLAHYARFHAYPQAQELAESTGSKALSRYIRLYREALYPRAYASWVTPQAKANNTSDLFIFSLMRKESNYRPFAVSPADARGLLQLIPPTAAAVAQTLGQPFAVDELFNPERNIVLGVTYVGELLNQFQGQEALAAGAYNAGGKAMSRWCDQWGGRPLDEFIELITYDQAREYIKRVLAIYAEYRYLYATPLELSLTLPPYRPREVTK